MDDKQNYLRKKIGIFYKNESWVHDISRKIIESIPKDAIGSVRCGFMKVYSIELKDGTTIQFIRASDSARGYCFSDVYVQIGIDYDIYNTVIAHTLKLAPRAATMVDDIRDFSFGVPAPEWYRRQDS